MRLYGIIYTYFIQISVVIDTMQKERTNNMKRFITVIPIQEPEKLKKGIYEPVGDAPLIQKTREVRFPIFIPMENSVTDGERISVIAVMTDHDRVRTNYDTCKR